MKPALVVRITPVGLLILSVMMIASTAYGAIAPYLQTPTATSIHVSWQSATTATPVVRIGTSTPDRNVTGVSDQLAPGVIWHDVAITGLTPGTVYTYRCVQGADSSALFTFSTAPPASDVTRHIRIGIISDSQEFPAMSTTVVDSMRAMAVRLWGDDPVSGLSLVLHVGDILSTGSELAQYQSQYFGPMARLSARVPFMVSIGNHEAESEFFYRSMRYGEFGGPAGDRYYSFRYGRVQFIALNTNTRHRNDAQIAWLDSVASAAENDESVDWIVSYGHHPALSEVWPDGNTTYTRDRILPTLVKNQKATLHLSGHTHAYEHGTLTEGPLHTVIFGGAGGALDRWRGFANQQDYPSVHRSLDHHGYALVDIDPAAGSLVFRAFSLGNQGVSGSGITLPNVEIDSFTSLKRKVRPEAPIALALPDTVFVPVKLSASAYAGSRALWSSQFQVRTAGGSFEPGAGIVADIQRDRENVYYDTGSPAYAPIDKNAGIDLTQCILPSTASLAPGTYFWRCRYRDVNLDWSAWSAEGSFVIGDPASFGGLMNRAMRFDGSTAFIEMGASTDSVILPVRTMTVEAWVRPEALPVYGAFLGVFQDNNGYQKGWVLGNILNHFSFGLASTGADDGNGKMTYLQDPVAAMTGRWYHVAGVYDGTQMRLYVNGQQVASGTAQSGDILYDPDSFFDVGAYHDANEFSPYKGTLDEVRMWNVALSAEDIRASMFTGIDPAHPRYASLLSCWNFNEGAGEKIRDLTGNNAGVNNGLSPADNVISTAPLGSEGALMLTQTPITLGATGTGMVVAPTSPLSASNTLGVYIAGSPDGGPVASEQLPSGIGWRANRVWGFWREGQVTGSAGLSYGQLPGIAPDALLRLLYRPAADTAWVDATDDHYQDTRNHQFIVSGPLVTGVYAVGWANPVSAVGEGNGQAPSATVLLQNYPNPGNPSTSLRFDLATPGEVSLVVMNLLGQQVKLIEDRRLSAGTHVRSWDLHDDRSHAVPSGMYFCVLSAGGSTSTVKVLVVR